MEGSPERASAMKLQMDGQEIAALLIENFTEAAAREGRNLQPSDLVQMLAPLLSAAWAVAQQTCPGDAADGGKNVPDRGALDLRNKAVADKREGVRLERIDPLILVLPVLPSCLVLTVHHLGGFTEGWGDHLDLLSFGDDINASLHLFTDCPRRLTCLGEAQFGE